MGEERKMMWLFVFKIKQEMYIVNPAWQGQCPQNCSWRNLLQSILAFWISYLVSLRYIKLLNNQSKLLPIRLTRKYLAVHNFYTTNSIFTTNFIFYHYVIWALRFWPKLNYCLALVLFIKSILALVYKGIWKVCTFH